MVSVPELLGMLLGTSLYLVQIDRIIRVTHSPEAFVNIVLIRQRKFDLPPIHDCTPYQIQAMAARLKTGHREPQMPKEDLLTTGKEIWYVAPIRPVIQMKVPEMVYPIQTQSHDCHQERPLAT